MNPASIVVLIAVASCVLCALVKIISDKKNGKHQCSGDCSRCGGCSQSSEQKKVVEDDAKSSAQ